jgi:hypothetical protein
MKAGKDKKINHQQSAIVNDYCFKKDPLPL